MSSAAAISGEFTTIKHVPSRKVYQLVVEIAEEAAQQAFEALGMPGNGGHVALARLHSPAEPIAKPEAPKEREAFSRKPRSQQAGILCEDKNFQRFLAERYQPIWSDAPPHTDFDGHESEWAAHTVRTVCKVVSRSNLLTGSEAAEHWDHLEAEYYAWQRGRR